MKLIINADDFGMTKGVNDGIIELLKLGTLQSTTVMVNQPYAEECVDLLKIPGISVGMHFNLTEGRPLNDPAKVKSLVDSDGIFLNKKTLELNAKEGKVSVDEVLLELSAQIEKIQSWIGADLTHFDSHQGLNRIPTVFKALIAYGPTAKKYNLGIRTYEKHYLRKQGAGLGLVKPSFTKVGKFSPRRIMVEFYLGQKHKQLDKFYRSTAGMLVPNSHQSIDAFRLMAQTPSKVNFNRVLEIPCHPAATVEELTNTKLVQSRLDEYELLKSPEFVKLLNVHEFLNYKQI